MGSPESEWSRGAYSEDAIAVTLTRGFYLAKHEVTQAEWTSLGFDNPTGTKLTSAGPECTNDPSCPVASATFFEAAAYANALSEKAMLPPCYALTDCSGAVGAGMICGDLRLTSPTAYECNGYRLPTEAEWEYAARAGTQTAFYSGDITDQGPLLTNCCEDRALDAIAWYCANSGGTSHPVGQKAPNAWGLHDMAGNVLEWVTETYASTTPTGPLTDPGGTLSVEKESVLRGGAYWTSATAARSSSGALDYGWDLKYSKGLGFGFRLARSIPPTGGDR
ncbi:MAG: formylglycine-generating enzyme family protein [Labilithrix sp.]|nr:formylglycine-generating enzyme family protein [Labilithrix sp.]